MKSNGWLRASCLLILLVSMIPATQAGALAASAPPPVDMFQLPWDQGIAWYAIDGIDNGTKRPASSSHNYRLGGAIDFAPHLNMTTGENTANFWVTAAAAGTVVATSTCYLTISHDSGWVTQYQFLGNIQVRLGDTVARNQRIGVIADGVRYRYCPGYQEINIPHLHFMLRPSTIDASFAGWQVKYNSLFNGTTFTKNGTTVGLNRPLLNTMDGVPTPTPATTTPATSTPPAQPTATPTNGSTATPMPTLVVSPTPTLSGPYVSTTITPQSIAIGASALVTVRLNNVPTEGYKSSEFTCSYNANLFSVGNISITTLFGTDPVSAINGPEPQRLIVAIAGSDGQRATISGAAFTFDVTGLQPGQTVIECRARVSQGTNTLTEIPFVVDYLTVEAATSTPTAPVTSTPAPASPTSTLMPTSTFPSATPTVVSTPLGPGDLVPSLSFVPVVTGLSQPVFVTHAGDGSGRLFVLERVGRVRVITNTGSLLSTSFLDLTSIVGSSGSEEGLLGLAFHPNYESNGLFFVSYTNTSGDLVLAKYSVSSDSNAANPASAAILLTIPHPGNSNHNGGMLAFGNDGYLYWSTGDGGGGGDAANNAQNVNSLLGKILRLDINSGSPYAIPPDNPFVGVAGARGEIWAYGLRNPWRFSFDRTAQDMYIGDVGQGNREEIDFETSSSSGGLNYGWRVMEGSLCFNPSSGCDTSGKVLPVAEYDNNSATCAVTGGYVYRGSQSPQMTGIYFYGDYCGGQIWGLLQQSPGVWDSDLIMDTSFLISSFGEDEGGELYLTDYSTGSVQKIVTSGTPLPTPTITSFPMESPTPTAPAVPTETLTPLPSFTSTPFPASSETPLPTFTFTPDASMTPTPGGGNGAISGRVLASKPVTVSVYDSNNALVVTLQTNPDGSFQVEVAPGSYTVIAAAPGFLRAQANVPNLTAGVTRTLPQTTLLAGDIDGNSVIDQFDALTIGMGYNSSTPSEADLNNDGIINVLDLEALARNYRMTGPTVWQ